MPITVLDEKTALILVDLQKGVVGLPVAHPVDTILSNATGLLNAFRRNALPIVLVRVVGAPKGRSDRARRTRELPAGWDELVPQLDVQSSDHVVAKNAVGAFADTDLREHLDRHGVTQVVIAGIATSSGVESTVREAFDLGFNVTLPVDAMTDTSLETHTHAVTAIFPKFGETGSTADVLALLSR